PRTRRRTVRMSPACPKPGEPRPRSSADERESNPLPTERETVASFTSGLLPSHTLAPPASRRSWRGYVTPARSVTVLPDVSLNVQPPASPGRALVLVFASESCWL